MLIKLKCKPNFLKLTFNLCKQLVKSNNFNTHENTKKSKTEAYPKSKD